MILQLIIQNLLDTAIRYTFVPDIDIQQACTFFLQKIYLCRCPILKLRKKAVYPKSQVLRYLIKGNLLGKRSIKKSRYYSICLKKKQGRYARLSYMWKNGGEESPLTVEVVDNHKQWKISNDKIDASYKLKFSVEEFPHDSLDKKKVIKEVEEFLSKEMTKEFNEVVKKLQEAKSDAVGFGRPVRAFHPHYGKKGIGHDTFSELAN